MKSRRDFSSDKEYEQYLKIYISTQVMSSVIISEANRNYSASGSYSKRQHIATEAIEYAEELISQLHVISRPNYDDE